MAFVARKTVERYKHVVYRLEVNGEEHGPGFEREQDALRYFEQPYFSSLKGKITLIRAIVRMTRKDLSIVKEYEPTKSNRRRSKASVSPKKTVKARQIRDKGSGKKSRKATKRKSDPWWGDFGYASKI